jgi:hypothetical protein
VNARGEERFIGVDVADAGHHLLVHKNRLNGAAAPAQAARELESGDAESVRAEAAPSLNLELGHGAERPEAAEPPRVTEAEAGTSRRGRFHAPDAMNVVEPGRRHGIRQ